MYPRRMLCLLVILAALVTQSARPQTAEAASNPLGLSNGDGMVSGYVQSYSRKETCSGLLVVLSGPFIRCNKHTFTDGDGAFAFTVPSGGSYTVTVRRQCGGIITSNDVLVVDGAVSNLTLDLSLEPECKPEERVLMSEEKAVDSPALEYSMLSNCPLCVMPVRFLGNIATVGDIKNDIRNHSCGVQKLLNRHFRILKHLYKRGDMLRHYEIDMPGMNEQGYVLIRNKEVIYKIMIDYMRISP